MSQIVAMASRLQEAEQMILQLKKQLEMESEPVSKQPGSANVTTSPASESRLEHRATRAQPHVRSLSNEPTSEELLSDLSLDEHGKVSGFCMACGC